MNHESKGRIYFFSAYLALTTIFSIIHFTRAENFEAQIGDFSLAGRSSIGTAFWPSSIKKLRLYTGNIEIPLQRNKIFIVTEDGIRHPLSIERWESLGEAIKVGFSNGVGFVLEKNPGKNTSRLIPIIPETMPAITHLEIPLHLVYDDKSSQQHELQGVIRDTQNGYTEFFPKKSILNEQSGMLSINVADKAQPIVELANKMSKGYDNAVDWLASEESSTVNEYVVAFNQWLATVRRGWATRLDPNAGLWINENGKPVWSDKLAAALLSESLKNNDYTNQVQSVLNIGKRAPFNIGWLPSPYLGNIVNQTQGHIRDMTQAVDKIRQNLAAGFPAELPLLAVSYLMDAGYDDVANQLVSLTLDMPEDEMSLQETINRIAVLYDALELKIGNTATILTTLNRLFNDFILPKIFRINGGLWLVDNDKEIPISFNVLVAQWLMNRENLQSKNIYKQIGRTMMLSLFSLADDTGAVPSLLTLNSEGDFESRNRIMPEAIYPLIIQDGLYPRHVSLARDLGPGVWVLTGAANINVVQLDREININMDFPVGNIHHMAISGLEKVIVVYMNRQRWKTDPNFQRYYAGWYYEESTETLYIKVRHRSNTETIRILYYDPDPPTVFPENSEPVESNESEPVPALN